MAASTRSCAPWWVSIWLMRKEGAAMWRLIYGLLGSFLRALAGLVPIGWTLRFFGGDPSIRYCGLVGGVVGALAGLVFGPWFVGGAFVGVLGSVFGGLVGYEARNLYIQHLSPG